MATVQNCVISDNFNEVGVQITTRNRSFKRFIKLQFCKVSLHRLKYLDSKHES